MTRFLSILLAVACLNLSCWIRSSPTSHVNNTPNENLSYEPEQTFSSDLFRTLVVSRRVTRDQPDSPIHMPLEDIGRSLSAEVEASGGEIHKVGDLATTGYDIEFSISVSRYDAIQHSRDYAVVVDAFVKVIDGNSKKILFETSVSVEGRAKRIEKARHQAIRQFLFQLSKNIDFANSITQKKRSKIVEEKQVTQSTPAKTTPLLSGTTVAVFDIQDSSKSIGADALSQLTDYLITQVTEKAEIKVIPRAQLRARLTEQKVKGYGVQYDKDHQVKLGKAVAAQKFLATKILRVGNSCALTSNLYDLETETSIGAASAETDCSNDSLMGAVKLIAEKLGNKGR